MTGGLWLSAVCVGLIVVLLLVGGLGKGNSRGSFKQSAKRLERAHPVRSGGEKERQSEAERLHPDATGISPGLTIGLMGKKPLYQGWRECSVHVWGTGRGKTSSEVIRHAGEAPGAFIVTANKPDGILEIIAMRRDRGHIWIYDPQQIFTDSDEPGMTIDLFSSITDTMSADEVAGIFDAASAGEATGSRDAQFDSQGRDLLSACFQAASIAGLPPIKVLEWISSGKLREPERILHDNGQAARAAILKGISQQPEDTRGSVVATAQRMGSALGHDVLLRWTERIESVRRFDPDQFIKSNDTLILLSQETAGSSAAFISTIIHSVFRSAETETRRTRGRLAVPLVADLDEVGNVVTLPKLPQWYSYFGSLGIVVSAYYQTKGQGVGQLKKSGWETLWAAAAVRVYGGGSDDEDLLKQLNAVSGRYEHRSITTSTSRMQRSSSTSHQQRDIMPIDKLADMPQWRAWVRLNVGGTAIVQTVPWFQDKELREWIEDGKNELEGAL